jgi:hypothetical protein
MCRSTKKRKVIPQPQNIHQNSKCDLLRGVRSEIRLNNESVFLHGTYKFLIRLYTFLISIQSIVIHTCPFD